MISNMLPEYPAGHRAIEVLGVDPHDLCLNQRLHWAKRAKRTEAAKASARAAWNRHGSIKAAKPVRYRLRVYRARAIDEGAVVEGCKAIVDGIFRDGVTPDDSAKWCILDGVEMITGKDNIDRRRSPRVVVIWWEVPE